MKTALLFLSVLFTSNYAIAQNSKCDSIDADLASIYAKIHQFLPEDSDSAFFYSDLFASYLTKYLNQNPNTLNCDFKTLTTNNYCKIVTTDDGLFRIYSWNTFMGGTMINFNNLFQSKMLNPEKSNLLQFEKYDFAPYYTQAYTLKTSSENFFIAIGGGSFSSRDIYKLVEVFTISGNNLSDSAQLIKTENGFENSITVEFDMQLVGENFNQSEDLIKYDSANQTLYLPILLENGELSKEFTRYKFNGNYFEKVITEE